MTQKANRLTDGRTNSRRRTTDPFLPTHPNCKTSKGEKRIERHNPPFNCDDGAAPEGERRRRKGRQKSIAKTIDSSTTHGLTSDRKSSSSSRGRRNSHLFTQISLRPETAVDDDLLLTDRDRPVLSNVSSLPSFVAVARKDVVAGELPAAAAATTQVQDGGREGGKGRWRRREGGRHM